MNIQQISRAPNRCSELPRQSPLIRVPRMLEKNPIQVVIDEALTCLYRLRIRKDKLQIWKCFQLFLVIGEHFESESFIAVHAADDGQKRFVVFTV